MPQSTAPSDEGFFLDFKDTIRIDFDDAIGLDLDAPITFDLNDTPPKPFTHQD